MFCHRKFCKGNHKKIFTAVDCSDELKSYEYLFCESKILLGHLGCTILNSMKGWACCEKDDCCYCGHVRQIYEEFNEKYVSSQRTDVTFQPVLWCVYHTRNIMDFIWKLQRMFMMNFFWKNKLAFL